MPCAPISTASAASSPPSRASAPRAASSLLVYLVQIMLIAGVGIVDRPGGRRCDAVSSAARCCRRVIPVPAEGGALSRRALAMAALFGLLVTLAFALLPLGRARDVPATALFREMGFEGRGLPRLALCRGGWPDRAGCLPASPSGFRTTAASPLIFVGATIFAFVVLRSVGGLRAMARPPQPARPLDGAAAGDRQHPPSRRADALGRAVARPRPDAAGHAGADRRQSAPADLRQPDRSARRTSSSSISRAARSTAFDALVRQEAPDGKLVKVPMLRGRVMAINGVDVAEDRTCRPRAPGCCAATAA